MRTTLDIEDDVLQAAKELLSKKTTAEQSFPASLGRAMPATEKESTRNEERSSRFSARPVRL